MRIILIGLAILVCNNTFSQDRKLKVETAIQNVTVFSSGAQIERVSSVNIQSGRTEISFAGLSNQLDQQTVQLKADANITLLSVQTTKDFLSVRKIEQQEQEFIDRTNALKDKYNMDQKLLEVYKNEEAMLSKNQSIGGEEGVKTVELKQALEFQRQRLTEVFSKELEIQKQLNAEQHELEANKEQLREISKKRDSISYIVTALVDSKETRTVNFRLLYNVKDAGWYPTYDVRVTDVSSPLGVLMTANVFQRSGETWKNIPIQLSTGNPKDNATPSTLQPWMLGYYDPSVSLRGTASQGEISGRVTNENGEPIMGAAVSTRSAGMGIVTDANGYFKLRNIDQSSMIFISCVGYQSKQVRAGLGYISISLAPAVNTLDEVVVSGYGVTRDASEPVANEQVMLRQAKKESIQTVTIATQFQPTAMIYRIDDKYTLESDGKTTAIGIKQFDIPASYEYYSAPKIDASAFLNAKIVGWQDYNLQSGEVSLYFEGTYLGKTYLDLSSVADTLSLSLGRDNGISISRKLLKEFSTKKFIGSNRTDSRQYEITIRNSKKSPVNITIVDQIPVSTVKEISVDDIKAPDAQINKETGIVTWTLTLAPGVEKKLGLSYSVKYPKDRVVVLE
jgi:hypothetical protein